MASGSSGGGRSAGAVPSANIIADPDTSVSSGTPGAIDMAPPNNPAETAAVTGQPFGVESYMKSHFILTDEISWTTDMPVGYVLWSKAVHPHNCNPIVRYQSANYYVWSGGLDWQFIMNGTGFNGGKLMVVFTPPGTPPGLSLNNMTCYPFAYFDVKSLGSLEFKARDMRLQKAHWMKADTSTDLLDSRASTGGTMHLIVYLRLQNSTGSAGRIDLNILSKLADDFLMSYIIPPQLEYKAPVFSDITFDTHERVICACDVMATHLVVTTNAFTTTVNSLELINLSDGKFSYDQGQKSNVCHTPAIGGVTRVDDHTGGSKFIAYSRTKCPRPYFKALFPIGPDPPAAFTNDTPNCLVSTYFKSSPLPGVTKYEYLTSGYTKSITGVPNTTTHDIDYPPNYIHELVNFKDAPYTDEDAALIFEAYCPTNIQPLKEDLWAEVKMTAPPINELIPKVLQPLGESLVVFGTASTGPGAGFFLPLSLYNSVLGGIYSTTGDLLFQVIDNTTDLPIIFLRFNQKGYFSTTLTAKQLTFKLGDIHLRYLNQMSRNSTIPKPTPQMTLALTQKILAEVIVTNV